jgi:hypothetical protein
VLAQMSAWGLKYLPVTDELGIRAKLLKVGGPKLWDEFMDELRETHLGEGQGGKARKRSVTADLQSAYEAVAARRKKR